MTDDRATAFESFVLAHGMTLAGLARLLTRSRDEADDLTQVTLERVFVRWRAVSAADNPLAYARRMLAHAAIDAARTRQRRPVTTELIDLPRSGPTATSVIDDRAALRDWLAALPARQRAVVVLRYYADLSEAETAETLGISRGAVKAHAHRGLARLRMNTVEDITGSEERRD